MFAAKNEGFPNLHRSGQSALTAVFEVVMILPSSRPTVCAAPVPPGRIIEAVQDLQETGNHRPINTKNHTSQTVSAHCFFKYASTYFHFTAVSGFVFLAESLCLCLPGQLSSCPGTSRCCEEENVLIYVDTCWYAIPRYV